MTLIQLLRFDRGEVGLGHLSQLDVRKHDLSRHFVNRDANTLVLLVQVVNLGCFLLFDLLLRLDKIINILLKLTDPDLLLVPPTMTEVVTHYTILRVSNKLGLSLFVKSMENDNGEGRCLVFIVLN